MTTLRLCTLENNVQTKIVSFFTEELSLKHFKILRFLDFKVRRLHHIHSEVIKTIQATHARHHHNGFGSTYRLWTASGIVYTLLVLQPSDCSTSTKQGV